LSDDFPKPGEGSTVIKYGVRAVFSNGPISKNMSDGTATGNLLIRTAQLLSSLKAKGASTDRAIKTAPFRAFVRAKRDDGVRPV
jgi:hypothetical protein